MMIAACGNKDENLLPTFTPTQTLTPTLRSTPLPEAATPVPLGSEDRPLRIGFVATGSNASVLRNLQSDLNELLDGQYVLEITSYPSMGTALADICNGSTPTMAWVDAFTYIAAEERCGAVPTLGLELTKTQTQARSFDIIFEGHFQPQPSALEDIVGKRWCRISASDEISWIYPSLAMQTAGLNPLTALSEIIDVADYKSLVKAIFDGDCDMGAIPSGTLVRLVRQLEREDRVEGNANNELIIDLEGMFNVFPDVNVLLHGAEAWPLVPSNVLVAPDTIVLPADVRNAIVNALEEIASDDSNRTLSRLLDYQSIEPRNPNDYSAFRTWLISANWAMSR